MSKVKFTKGPWSCHSPVGSNGFWYVDNSPSITTGSVATLYTENAMANAHLIAAAPEMYEMLDRVTSNYQEAASVAEHEGYETKYAQDKVFVDALLAKARGEQ